MWVLDPIDGTVNYAYGLGGFCVSLGLLHDGRPAAGWVLDPLRDELFSAVAGRGATLDGEPLATLPPRRRRRRRGDAGGRLLGVDPPAPAGTRS